MSVHTALSPHKLRQLAAVNQRLTSLFVLLFSRQFFLFVCASVRFSGHGSPSPPPPAPAAASKKKKKQPVAKKKKGATAASRRKPRKQVTDNGTAEEEEKEQHEPEEEPAAATDDAAEAAPMEDEEPAVAAVEKSSSKSVAVSPLHTTFKAGEIRSRRKKVPAKGQTLTQEQRANRGRQRRRQATSHVE